MSVKETDKGEVIVFAGSGKGKTAAALGVSCRSVAHGGRVIFIYFTGQPSLCELKATSEFGESWKIVYIKTEIIDAAILLESAESVQTPAGALSKAQQEWLRKFDLLVLDDIARPLNNGNVNISQVIALIDNRPLNTSIIFTGESFPEAVIEKADLVTEFHCIK